MTFASTTQIVFDAWRISIPYALLESDCTLGAGMNRSRFLVLVEDITERVQNGARTRTQQKRDHRAPGRASEHRDEATGFHVTRMARFCEALAEAMEVPADQCRILRSAAPMHDIGKIGIPDTILLKPGKLSPEEFEVMKTHTKIGGDVLSGSSHDSFKWLSRSP